MQFTTPFLLFALLATTGCATRPELANLRPPQSTPTVMSLPSNLCTQIAGAFGKESQVCLLNGSYRLEKENPVGRFYAGLVPSVHWKIGADLVLAQGGVWIPTDQQAAPRIYYYIGTTFSAKTLPELEAARTASSQSAAAKPSVADPTTSIVTMSAPTSATPVQAGLGGAIASGLVAAMADFDSPMLYPEAKSGEFTATVRQVFAR